MFQWSGNTIDELFLEALDSLRLRGRCVAPRGIETLEIFPALFELANPQARVLTVAGRRINPAFAVAEALWILSGSDAPWIFSYNSKLQQYANDGRLRGAYGPRLRAWAGLNDQLDLVRKMLISDPATRRAVVQIYDPGSVAEGDLDVPCTIGYRFMIRNNQLHLFTTMRSQDLWLGFPYDIFSNTIIQELMAGWVGVAIGNYYHSVDSLHLYKRDLDAAVSVTGRDDSKRTMDPISVEWDKLQGVLELALDGSLNENHSLSPLARILESHRSWKAGDRTKARALVSTVGGPLRTAIDRWYNGFRAAQ